MMTFSDGKVPPALDALKDGGVPFKKYYKFNNSALYEDNKEVDKFLELFWEMGVGSFSTFFNDLPQYDTKSLLLTKEVLKERESLQAITSGLLPQIDKGLNTMRQIEEQQEFVNNCQKDIEASKNFTMVQKQPAILEEPLEQGIYITNCIVCRETCHFPCNIPQDSNKRGCAAIDGTGKCEVCPGHCSWERHTNDGRKLIHYEEEIVITLDHLKEKYHTATSGKELGAELLSKMQVKFDRVKSNVKDMMDRMVRSINRLAEIALKPDPLNNIEYIDILLEAEKSGERAGKIGRIQELEKLKREAQLVQNAQKGQNPLSG